MLIHLFVYLRIVSFLCFALYRQVLRIYSGVRTVNPLYGKDRTGVGGAVLLNTRRTSAALFVATQPTASWYSTLCMVWTCLCDWIVIGLTWMITMVAFWKHAELQKETKVPFPKTHYCLLHLLRSVQWVDAIVRARWIGASPTTSRNFLEAHRTTLEAHQVALALIIRITIAFT
jgi:hypothetical protein